MIIQWNDSLCVDIAEIDAQHLKLVSLINELAEAMSLGKGKSVIGRIVDGLVSYAETHFRTEEKYFVLFGYPEAPSHQQEHAMFSAQVAEFRDGFAQGRIALSIEVMSFLSNWLRNHILVSDKKYAPFLTAKGVR